MKSLWLEGENFDVCPNLSHITTISGLLGDFRPMILESLDWYENVMDGIDEAYSLQLQSLNLKSCSDLDTLDRTLLLYHKTRCNVLVQQYLKVKLASCTSKS